MNLAQWIQLLAVVGLGTAAQLALKAAIDNGKPAQDAEEAILRRLLRSPLIWVWFLCYVVSTSLWLWALRTIPLSQAFPILGLQFALVPLASSHFLGEKLSWKQWLGIAIIVIGVAFVGRP
ncbi:MAG: EamA family transporter [Pseudomonadota bacterium]